MAEQQIAVIGVGSPIVDSLAMVDDAFLAAEVKGAKGGMEMVDSATMAAIISKLPRQCTQAPGGAAANTVRALARLGQPTALLGKLGDDENAVYYERIMREAGVANSCFKRARNCPNARCLSLVTADAQRTMRTDLAAAATLGAEEIRPADFAGAGYVYIEGYLLFNRELAEKVFACAREAGCKICLNCGSFEVVRALHAALVEWVAKYVDIIFANLDEAREFLENSGISAKEAALAIASGERIAVVTDGKNGACVAQNGKVVGVDALSPRALVDTTGAGDFFAAGFLWGVLKGCSLARAAYAGTVLSREIIAVTGVDLEPAVWRSVKQECEKIA